MKNVFSIIAWCIMITLFAQSPSSSTYDENQGVKVEHVKIEKVKIEVEVDSAEEIASTFSVTDFEDILSSTNDEKELIFKITCHGQPMSNGETSSLSYEIKGHTKDKTNFLKRIEKAKDVALKYYKSK